MFLYFLFGIITSSSSKPWRGDSWKEFWGIGAYRFIDEWKELKELCIRFELFVNRPLGCF